MHRKDSISVDSIRWFLFAGFIAIVGFESGGGIFQGRPGPFGFAFQIFPGAFSGRFGFFQFFFGFLPLAAQIGNLLAIFALQLGLDRRHLLFQFVELRVPLLQPGSHF